MKQKKSSDNVTQSSGSHQVLSILLSKLLLNLSPSTVSISTGNTIIQTTVISCLVYWNGQKLPPAPCLWNAAMLMQILGFKPSDVVPMLLGLRTKAQGQPGGSGG